MRNFSYDLSVVDTVTKHLVRDNFVVLGGLELINDWHQHFTGIEYNYFITSAFHRNSAIIS